ncbi:MAG: hypothetical protein QOD90_314 [Mycobacterium sp.]|jgi:hypothetical protein|nr:hypothetical protein [Mycobacterium sp.]
MSTQQRLIRSALLAVGPFVVGVAGLVGAPVAAAGCNDSSGTVVCAQGDIRGTHGPAPARSDLGAWGTWCNDSVCFSGGGLGIVVGP